MNDNDFESDADSRLADQESIALAMSEYADKHRTADAGRDWLSLMPDADRFLSSFEAAERRIPANWQEIEDFAVKHDTRPRFVELILGVISGGKDQRT